MNDLRSLEAGSPRLRSHSVHLDDRSLLSITGVADVSSFNETEVALLTEAGEMIVEGAGLHISKLDLEEGRVMIEGAVSALIYEDEPPKKQGSLLSRMFR